MWLKSLFFCTLLFGYTKAARILGIFPIAGPSHYILASKLMRGLLEAGHDVTMVSPFPLKNPPKNGKYTDVILDEYYKEFLIRLKKLDLYKVGLKGLIEQLISTSKIYVHMANQTLHHPKMKNLVQSNQKFDAVIMEQFRNDAYKVYAHIFQCPLIILSSIGPTSLINPTVGNPQPIAYVPHYLSQDLSLSSPVSRAKNLFYHLLDFSFKTFNFHPKHEGIVRALYPDSPSLFDLYTNVSLLLLNSHTSLYPAVPLVPNMIEIGGFFIDEPKKLPEDLQEFLDSASEGAIYFSMGSNLKSKDISDEKKHAILNVLGKLKQKVIWKFEEDLPGRPINVMIRKWLPQNDILAHANVKLFITHGGLLSTTEAINHGIPILAIPVFADQPANAQRAVANGYGLKLDYHDSDFTEQKFSYLINELLTNPAYRDSVKEKSKLYHDRPMKPMETAIYWIEYVIRHKGAPHLKVAGIKLAWYQYFMVDVIGAIVAVFVMVFYCLKRIIKSVFCKAKLKQKIN